MLRQIPSVHELLECPPLAALVARLGRPAVLWRVRGALDGWRRELRRSDDGCHLPPPLELAQQIAEQITADQRPALRAVINATGILLHTGLGRAPLAAEAIDAITSLAGGYASVEIDLASGKRSHRVRAVEPLLRELTGAEAAVVVNNNAAATLLVLAALAAPREVIVSRGELIEIGGSFRLPDVMAASGAVLREVGTTNKTRLDDYRRAIGPETAALMLVHTSNYVVTGFAESTPLGPLVALAREHGLPVIHDVGSGALVDLSAYGGAEEPLVADSVRTGADVVLFSGDKLLGGPQCGIIVGRRTYLDRIARHPLMRAMRVDKLTLAALAATLRLYRRPEVAWQQVPLLALLQTPLEELEERARTMAERLASAPGLRTAEARRDVGYLGGGAVPTQQVPTWCVVLGPAGMRVDELAAALRAAEPAVVGRVQQERLVLDLRTVLPEQAAVLEATVVDVLDRAVADQPPDEGVGEPRPAEKLPGT